MVSDLISRQRLLSVVKPMVGVFEDDGFYLEYESVISAIENAPTVEPKHGQFLGTEYDGFADGNPVYYEWVCSECGCIFEDEEPTYNFCPNCGARMERSESCGT